MGLLINNPFMEIAIPIRFNYEMMNTQKSVYPNKNRL